ncbi:VanZ family protein [Methylobacter sp. S3L5C]|uniref:VanZ family protein n=1 Tax=Methylobacter sp. S3L5C TaxID=2839024 RepID=UPI001FABC5F7|nr:VanZ family protein [Methylobacter sp. S3L5C]UOA10573.1 VanZ family protein [Methylobacter sp. S3L5C]
MIKILDFALLLFYCLFIYWLSDQSSLKSPFDFGFDYQDKLYHAGAYFILALLAWRSFKHLIDSPIILALLSIAFCSLYGLSDEWHQSFVVGRESDSADWVADTSGAMLAILLLYKLTKIARIYVLPLP